MIVYFTFVCQYSTDKITKAFIANANLVSLLITWHHKKWFSFLVGNKGWFHFSIKASFTVDTKGWYCVTKGIISFSSLLFCFRSADFGSCEFNLFLIAGSLCPSSTIKRSFEFWNTFLKLFWQIGGWQGANVCWKVSVVFTSRKTFSLNLVPLYTTVSTNTVPVNFRGEFNSRMM